MKPQDCPFVIGDFVRFTPSKRTCGLYQDIEYFGVRVGEVYQIKEISDGMYLYFEDGKGGWPWNEFTPASSSSDAPLVEKEKKKKIGQKRKRKADEKEGREKGTP